MIGCGNGASLAPGSGAARHHLGQAQDCRNLAPPGCEPERHERQGLGSHAKRETLGLPYKSIRQRQLSRLDVKPRQVVESVGKQDQRPCRPREVGLTGSQLKPCLVVPQVHRRDVVGHAQPIQSPLVSSIGAEGAGQCRRRCGVPIGQTGRQAEQQ